MIRKRFVVITVPIVLLLGSIYASPHWTVRQMVAAAEGRDTEKFSQYVDYPALRESLKAQFAMSMDKQMGGGDNPFAAIGKMIGRAVADPVIEASVTPAGAMAMVVEEPSDSAASAPAGKASHEANYTVSYRSWDSVDASTTRANGEPFVMRLRRTGLWSWQWVGVAQAPAR